MKKYLVTILTILESNTQVKKIVFINAITFFIFWLIILLLGADMPPPIGFIFVIILLSILTVGLSIYCTLFILRMICGEKHLFSKKLFIWLIAGGIVGGFLALLPGGEPSIQQANAYEKLILFVVVIFVSMMNSIGFYIFNRILIKKL